MTSTNFERYVNYKDSGIEWLGYLPKDWGISRIKEKGSVKARVGWKALKASEYVEKGFAFLSTPNIKYKKIDFDNVNYITYERFIESPEIMLKEDDILLAKDGSTLGIVNIVSHLPKKTTVNSSIAVIRFNKTVFNKYLFYQIGSKYIQDKIQLKKGGMGVPHLFQQDINNFVILIPSMNEQTAIANYLDEKLALIDHNIDLLTQKAERYKELKQSLINKSITRGLDECVTLKYSGVECLGKIPLNWKVRRLKDLIYSLESGSREVGGACDDGVFSLSAEHIDWDGKYNFNSLKFIPEEYYDKMRSGKLKVGDTLLTKDGATIGKCAFLDRLYFDKMAINEHMFIMRANKSINEKFLYYLVTSSIGRLQIRFTMKSSAIPGINTSFINSVFFSVPDLLEQMKIVEYLDTKTFQISNIIEIINTQLEKQKELRKTLINDVVTGKIKVFNNEAT